MVCASPRLPAMTPHKVQARLSAFQGVVAPRGVHVQWESDPRQPCRQPRLTVVENGAIRVEHQAGIGGSHDPGLRSDVGDGLRHPRQSAQRAERCTTPAVRCACSGGRARVRCDDACTSPSASGPTDARWRVEFGQERRRIAAVKTRRDRTLQPGRGAECAAVQDRRAGLPTGTSWAQSLGVRRPFGVPLGFQGRASQRLPCPCVLGGQAARTFGRASALGDPCAPKRGGAAGEAQPASTPSSLGWGARCHPVAPRRVLPARVVGHPTPREPPRLPGRAHQVVACVSRSDVAMGRSWGQARVEAEAMPRDFLPREGVPGHHQARGIRCCGASPRTHAFPLPHTGPTSASPGRSPGLGLLRASFAPGACRWHRLGEVTTARSATGGAAVPRSHGVPLEDGAVHRVGRQCRPVSGTGCRRLLLCHVGSSMSASGAGFRARWRNHTCAGAVHGCLRDGIPGVRLPGSAVAPRFRPLRARRRPGGEAVTPAPGGRGLHPHAELRSKVHHHLAVYPEAVASFRPTGRTEPCG